MKFRLLILFLVFSLTGIYSCKKKPQKIGSDLQPSNSLITVSFNDAQDIVASTYKIPFLNTTKAGYSFIGNMNDPIFGNSNFDFYTQFRLSSTSLNWGEHAVTDSVVLNLVYNGYYGDTTDKQLTVRVYELAEKLYADTTYKSNTATQCEATELGCLTFVPRPLTPIDSTLDRGMLSIPLDISIGNKLMEQDYENITEFQDAFYGLHVVCDKNEIPASAVSFNLTHSYSCLRVYYHNDTDTLKYDFVVKSSDVRYNHYTHDYSNSEIVFYDTLPENNKKLFVQGASGTRVWLRFPRIQQWADSLDGNVAINEAKLVLSSAVAADDTLYSPPTKLVVAAAKFNEADTTYAIIPDQLISAEYYGGNYNEDDREVWFRISEYIQNVIRNGNYATETNGLFIYIDQGALVPHRWDFHGVSSDSTDKRIRLDIVYSLIKN